MRGVAPDLDTGDAWNLERHLCQRARSLGRDAVSHAALIEPVPNLHDVLVSALHACATDDRIIAASANGVDRGLAGGEVGREALYARGNHLEW